MNVGAILDNVAGELDAQVLAYMQEYAIPPSLMDKVLDRIQSHMRQMKSEEYAQELMKTQIDLAVANTEHTGTEEQQPKSGTEVDDIEDFKKKVGIKGGDKNADILSEEKQQSNNDNCVQGYDIWQETPEEKRLARPGHPEDLETVALEDTAHTMKLGG